MVEPSHRRPAMPIRPTRLSRPKHQLRQSYQGRCQCQARTLVQLCLRQSRPAIRRHLQFPALAQPGRCHRISCLPQHRYIRQRHVSKFALQPSNLGLMVKHYNGRASRDASWRHRSLVALPSTVPKTNTCEPKSQSRHAEPIDSRILYDTLTFSNQIYVRATFLQKAHRY